MPIARLGSKSSSNFAQAIRDCIRVGGCSASRAAVVGAFIAARHSIDAIPIEWISKYQNAAKLSDAIIAALLRNHD
eukprot:CAMPEP_0197332982 /NCGR_PEP_ID=MMETSP0892-20130614/22600_1 /TAXON_ID=44058 ORGANISM="Aureoumbra lagunensis, Strain CCMP1510" /NCGR_SAMPLE_ID=MMETSP0892 /ASSEMBLY_ACC=CAM_ASM_000538 /LENGTH=75 /DNA_ID=CAMNT_0042832283 /DNA_START=1 /DNA_END=228 /DNA_ORIENTATION=-